MEEARTNLLLRSSEFDNASWTKLSSTVTANFAVSPSGASDADIIKPSIGQAPGAAGAFQSVVFGASAAVSASVWVKASTLRAEVVVQARNSGGTVIGIAEGSVNSAGTAFDATSVTGFTASDFRLDQFPNGWARVVFSGTTPALTTSVFLVIVSSDTGDGVNGPLAWGAQIEAGAFATSYIPTTTATVARAADSATVVGAAYTEWAPTSEGTLFRRFRPGHSLIGAAASRMVTTLSNAGLADRVGIVVLSNPTAPASDARVVVASVPQAETSDIAFTLPAIGAEVGQAVVWQAGSLAFSQGGTITPEVAFAASPVNDRLNILTTPDTAHIGQIVVFDTRIADEFLAGLTA
jgi:hypothetical protein